jgi:sensor histidine kinase YesM
MAVMLLCVLEIYVMLSVSSIVFSIADSYKTNVELDAYTSVLLSTEYALENYMKVRSFESIDNYFKYRSQLDTLTLVFHQRPSSDKLLFQEYKITRILRTFLGNADRALAARRANKIEDAEREYIAAETAYRYLSSSVYNLNTMYFRRNIASYSRQRSLFFHALWSVIILIVFVLLLIISWVMTKIHTITKPLEDISNVANELAKRNFNIPLLQVESRDEVGNICRAFNRMTVSIREYISTIWEKAEEENRLREREIHMASLYKDAQLRALQSQINPHFLFNTLNTGVQLAMMEEADKTSYFLEQVADFFRYNIRHQNRETTLTEEIALVDNYIYVMKVRFANRFVFHKQIEAADTSLHVPSMIIQPLVENCIKHGLYDSGKPGVINLHVYVPEDNEYKLCIDISDNGVGFPESLRSEILKNTDLPQEPPDNEKTPADSSSEIEKASSGMGIGLRNVISRLRIFYHSDDVFTIAPNTNPETGTTGTIFSIRIPYV